MKILLTGASGLVGGAVAQAAAGRGHEVIGIVGRFEGPLSGVTRKQAIDLTNEADTTRAVLDLGPEAIVNCAAIADPGSCDADPERSTAMNVALPALLARLAQQVGARLLHISSEQVFDGTRTTAYAVNDATSPINLYGRQKLAGERAVQEAAAARAAIVRAPLLMGNSPGGKRALHERLLADWAARRPVRLFIDEYRQPCTAKNLADVLVELVERPDLCGVFHWAGVDLLSRYELGLRVRDHFQLAEADAPISPVTRANAPEASRQRQACLALDLEPLVAQLKTQPQPLAEQLPTLEVPASLCAWYQSV